MRNNSIRGLLLGIVLSVALCQHSLLDGLSGVVPILKTRQELADKIKAVNKERLLFIAFIGKSDHLNKSDLAFFMSIHQALYQKDLMADFIAYSGAISDAMANQYSLHSFALPKVIVALSPGNYRSYDGGRKPIHVVRWIERLRRTSTDL